MTFLSIAISVDLSQISATGAGLSVNKPSHLSLIVLDVL
jgi:hypothetical protein